MLQIVLGFLVSFVVALFLVHSAHLHGRFSADSDLKGVQKFHTVPVPRIGGLAVFLGVLAAGSVLWLKGLDNRHGFALFVLVASPAFLIGLFEDLTKHGGVLIRLGLVMVAAGLGWYFLDARIVRLDLLGLDPLLALPLVSFFLTVFAVTGLTNAFNLIDGYNGLAGAVAAIMLVGIAYVAILNGDHLVWALAVSGFGAILGFLAWNWPRGLIFLGDGGAYFLGFLVAELAILLVARHPNVSPWFALVLAIYPIVETVFTIVRRRARQMNPGMPDAAHLHQLIYMRVMRWAVGSTSQSHRLMRNSMTSPYLWALSSLGVVPAVLFWNNTLALQISAFIFLCFYVWVYRAIVHFRFPRWLKVHK